MTKFIVKRLMMLVLVVFAAAIIIFTIMYFVPGDPAVLILGRGATVQQLAAKRAELGLNDPYIVRLGKFLSDVFLHLNLGDSYQRGVPVMGEILTRLPRTLIVGFGGVLLSAIVGIPLGILAATHQGKIADAVTMVVAMAGSALPGFWLALMLIILFALKLHMLPAFGIGSPQHYVLPIIASGFMGIGNNARQTRSSVLETIRADFVTSARAKGGSESTITYKHILPNALIPVITIIGSAFGFVIAGSIIIETVFTIPGIGLFLMTGIVNRDYPVIQGSVIFLAFMVSIVMLVVDLAYALVDPRIRAGFKHKGRV